MQNKVSIIIPVYNVPDNLLKKCITSAIHQTYENIEIIIVDDGTNQSNLNTIEDFADNKKVKIISKKNGGLSSARNYGVLNSTGDWICFVDGDDFIKKNTIRKLINQIDKNDEIVCFGTIKEYQNKSFNYDFNGIFKNKKFFNDNQELIAYLFDFRTQVGDATAKLYKKIFLTQNNIKHDERVKYGIESIVFNYHCFLKTKQLHYIDYYGYIYTYNSKSITSYQDDTCVENTIEGIKKLNQLIKKGSNSKLIHNLLLNRIQYIIVTTIISGYFSPKNPEKYKIKKQKLINFLNIPEIHESLHYDIQELDKIRKLVIILSRNNMFFLVQLIAIIRNLQKEKSK